MGIDLPDRVGRRSSEAHWHLGSCDHVTLWELGHRSGHGFGGWIWRRCPAPATMELSTWGARSAGTRRSSTHTGWVSAPRTERRGSQWRRPARARTSTGSGGSSTTKKVSASLMTASPHPDVFLGQGSARPSRGRSRRPRTWRRHRRGAAAPSTSTPAAASNHSPRASAHRQLQQDQGVDLLGMVKGQLGPEGPRRSLTGDVGAPDTEVLEERRGVAGRPYLRAAPGCSVRAARPQPRSWCSISWDLCSNAGSGQKRCKRGHGDGACQIKQQRAPGHEAS